VAYPSVVPRAIGRCSVLLSLALLALVACGPRPGEEKVGRGLIVIAVEALRADHVGALGYDRPTTPNLDALAAEGAVFRAAYSASPDVVPANAAILTGCDPMLARRIPIADRSRGTAVSDWYVPDALPRLPRALLGGGYATAAFTDHPAIAPVCGFGAGFQTFTGFLDEREDPSTSQFGIDAVSTKCLNWLSGLDETENWFAYLQVDDLERLWTRPEDGEGSFFDPRPELAAVPPVSAEDRVFFALPRSHWMGPTRSLGQLEARYDGELRHFDAALARLFDRLRRLGRWKDTTVVVVGTFGVGFGEGGLVADSGTFSDCDLRVPIVLRAAESLGANRGVRVDGLTSLIDLAPTLLDLHGIRPPPAMRGQSHLKALRGAADEFSTTVFAAGGFQSGFAAIDERFCYEEGSVGALEQEPSSPLSVSFFGDALDHRADLRAHLHDRTKDPCPGHLRPSAEDSEAIARLSKAGREHYGWIEKARAVLQGGTELAKDSAEMQELEQQGLLGELGARP
jgi:arylsulfatase A-like enzyme